MFLQIKQLNKSFGNRKVVANVDLEMQEGEIISLLGPSGCGKTTTLRMIAGLETPNSGLIKIGDRVVYDGKKEMSVEDRDLGMVFQDFALWPHMTVTRNIAFGMRLRRTPARKIASRVQELLELVNLPGMGDRYPHQLSGGQQQRVAVARALATEPRLVLLDEPLSSLDTALRETVGAELVQLFKRLKITTINVTHDQNEAMNMSDRIMVLRDGKVQQIGTPAELYLHPANAFVAGFMGSANLLYGDIIPDAGSNGTLALSLKYPGGEGRVVSGTLHKGILNSLNGEVALFCRPDDTRILTEEPLGNHPHIIPGVVLHSSFVAGRWRTLITIAEGQEKAMLAFSPTPIEANQSVWLELPAESCQIVPI